MRKHVIIVAGGSGSRMQQALPKQFIEILGKPIMVHTIEAFLAYDPSIHIVLVLPEAHLPDDVRRPHDRVRARDCELHVFERNAERLGYAASRGR